MCYVLVLLLTAQNSGRIPAQVLLACPQSFSPSEGPVLPPSRDCLGHLCAPRLSWAGVSVCSTPPQHPLRPPGCVGLEPHGDAGALSAVERKVLVDLQSCVHYGNNASLQVLRGCSGPQEWSVGVCLRQRRDSLCCLGMCDTLLNNCGISGFEQAPCRFRPCSP